LTWESEDLENKFYYPEKKEIKTNNIKFKIDSNIYSSRGYWIYAFDHKGRLIGSFDHSIDSFINPYQYVEKDDTLLRLRYTDKDKTIYSVEKFIYNKNGQIIQFDRFIYFFISDRKLELSRTIFSYENGKVSKKLSYRLTTIEKLSANFNISTKKMKLFSAKNYIYKQTKLGSYIIVSELMGDKDFRNVDTLIYDIQGRLSKHKSFAKRGYLFENFAANNVSRIEDYRYSRDSVYIHKYTSITPSFDHSNLEISDEEYMIRIIDKNGLEQKNLKGTTRQKLRDYDRMNYINY
jgi:hypothetical protein